MLFVALLKLKADVIIKDMFQKDIAHRTTERVLKKFYIFLWIPFILKACFIRYRCRQQSGYDLTQYQPFVKSRVFDSLSSLKTLILAGSVLQSSSTMSSFFDFNKKSKILRHLDHLLIEIPIP